MDTLNNGAAFLGTDPTDFFDVARNAAVSLATGGIGAALGAGGAAARTAGAYFEIANQIREIGGAAMDAACSTVDPNPVAGSVKHEGAFGGGADPGRVRGRQSRNFGPWVCGVRIDGLYRPDHNRDIGRMTRIRTSAPVRACPRLRKRHEREGDL